jgi:hypothetical protein
MKTFISLLLALFVIGAHVHADDAGSPPTSSSPDKPMDVDEIITNSKMRAASGSKSKYSIATSLSYAGGSLEDPLGTIRPNISGATGTTDVSLLSGAIGGKYTLSTQSSLFANVGFRWITPLAGVEVPANFNGDKFDADNPGVTYQYLYRWYDIQSSFSLSQTIFTNSNLLHWGYLTAWGFSQNNVYELGKTGLSVGLTANAGFSVFTKNDQDSVDHQSDYTFSFLPFLEYKIMKGVDVNTSFNLIAYQHRRSTANAWTFQSQTVTQSLGFGFEVYRDLYVSPSLLWIPGKLSSDTTLVALSVNLNIF